ncbi:MAG: neutral/alkaline non-lysosomal ceramidase N-terminal domain-containing protein [Armatimonadetes bacterium]|nr:neutral/alkaline non-lysosomal ceramidase N-terminal domain-containing protein [Armatimonadota bacterium]
MALRAGFAQVDITPPLGTHIIGWLRAVVGEQVLDPLYARVAVLESGGQTIAFVQLDTLSVRWTQVNDVRQRIAAQYGVAGGGVMVSATHTHAGPAVANCGVVVRDTAYVEELTRRIVEGFGQALAALQPAEIGMGWTHEFDVAHNRRVVQRDGTVRCHASLRDPNALCNEGPTDPEVAVIAVRAVDGTPLGMLLNYACHPTHHGGDGCFSAGFPGVFAADMAGRGWPVAMYLQGAAGNMHFSNPADSPLTMAECGAHLAADAAAVIEDLAWRREVRLTSRAKSIALPYRTVTDDEVAGTVFGAQRFVDPAIYDKLMPQLLERIRTRGTQPAEVQVHAIDEWSLVSMPAEYFVELGLRIKEESRPRHALVVAYANGMVGYVPHRDAFRRGGYETTFTMSSRQAPEAGDMLADLAVRLVRGD